MKERQMTHTVENSPIKTLRPDQLTTVIDEETIQKRLKEMGAAISETYKETDKLVIVAILKGSFMFLADLVRYIDVPCQLEFVRLASYGNSKKSSGSIRPVDLTLPNLADEDVLLVEDIIDSGLTLSFFIDYLQSLHKTKSLRLAVLLNKPEARSPQVDPVAIDYCGFEVGDEFLVGYGLDYAGFYRNLPCIAAIPPEHQ